jgi:cytidylate kinase
VPTLNPPGQKVIAIDGPAGSGKSTVARAVAVKLGMPYLDTGAMYRAVAFSAIRRGIDPEDAPAVAKLADEIGGGRPGARGRCGRHHRNSKP